MMAKATPYLMHHYKQENKVAEGISKFSNFNCRSSAKCDGIDLLTILKHSFAF